MNTLTSQAARSHWCGYEAISHSALAGLAAEIGRGSAKGAVAGALAAEVMATSMGNDALAPEQWNRYANKQAQIARLLGGVAGAVFTGDAKGAYSGADSGERVHRYDFLKHEQIAELLKESLQCKAKQSKAKQSKQKLQRSAGEVPQNKPRPAR
ncbi:hypothetical protein EVC62_16415 [Salinicola endophyticus]|uniref:Uncharacterized protein n=1 Tax=Salinicola endophyticus TaxID=1949083 RepID=A0ABY8FJF9_9GAMM|nr:hypothetical protein [Salinicola endophyticus]WFF42948.1 hypothetical protein EVC62_16415 [Salinicola endophyticus]